MRKDELNNRFPRKAVGNRDGVTSIAGRLGMAVRRSWAVKCHLFIGACQNCKSLPVSAPGWGIRKIGFSPVNAECNSDRRRNMWRRQSCRAGVFAFLANGAAFEIRGGHGALTKVRTTGPKATVVLPARTVV